MMIAVYSTKRAPLEAYEPYFEAEISDSTREVLSNIRASSQGESEEKSHKIG
ncbi:SSS family transporter [Halobacillus sp. BAB-2008]|nr:SSS family transporter [Halobacillus sp. BAB-2008]